MKTLQNRLEEAGVASLIGRLRHRAVAQFFACRCGREVPLDTMVDLDPNGDGTGIPEELRGQDRYRCAACCGRWVALGLLTANEMRELTQQPPLPEPSAGDDDGGEDVTSEP